MKLERLTRFARWTAFPFRYVGNETTCTFD